MKSVNALLALCLVFISAVVIYLTLQGTALRSAGVIKPTVLDSENRLLPKSVALRLFPEFQSTKNTIWIPAVELQGQVSPVVRSIHDYYKNLKIKSVPKLVFVDRETLPSDNFDGEQSRWWIFESENEAVLNAVREMESEPTMIYLAEFKRDETVDPSCETEKVLSRQCLKAVAVREVRKKIRSPEPYFFMRRYNDHEFYLFLEAR